MKYLALPILFCVCSISVQAQDYVDAIAKNSCACIQTVPDSLDVQSFNMRLGICMLDLAKPYKKQLLKDYKIDLDKIITDGKKLGELIGVRMASLCPDAVVKVSNHTSGKKESKEKMQTLSGVITKIEPFFFVTFSVKDDEGRITKFYWLNFIESEFDLPDNYESLVGKSVDINFISQDFFDPKIKEYRQYHVIRKMEITD